MTKNPSVVSKFFQKRQIISDIERGLITDVFDLPDFARHSVSVAQAFFSSPATLGGDLEEFSVYVRRNAKIVSLAAAKDITVLWDVSQSFDDSSKWQALFSRLDEDMICDGLINIEKELSILKKERDSSNLDTIFANSTYETKRRTVISLLSSDSGLTTESKIARLILDKWPERYEYMSDSFKDNEELTRLVVAKKGRLIRNASSRLRQRVDLWKIALSQDDTAMTNSKNVISEEERKLLSDKETIIPLLEINGDLLRSTPNADLLDDMDVVRTAITQDPYAFQYASERLKNDKELQWITFLKVPHAIYAFFDQSFDAPDDNRMIEFSQFVKMKSKTYQNELLQAYIYFDKYNAMMDKKADEGSSLKFDRCDMGGDFILSNLTDDHLNGITEPESKDAKELLEAERHKRKLMNIEKKSETPTSKKRSRSILLP